MCHYSYKSYKCACTSSSNQCTRGGGGGGGGGGLIVLSRFAVHDGHQPFFISYITDTYDQSIEYLSPHSIIGTLDATIVRKQLPPSINKHR